MTLTRAALSGLFKQRQISQSDCEISSKCGKNWDSRGVGEGGFKLKKPSMGGVGKFSGTTQ